MAIRQSEPSDRAITQCLFLFFRAIFCNFSPHTNTLQFTRPRKCVYNLIKQFGPAEKEEKAKAVGKKQKP